MALVFMAEAGFFAFKRVILAQRKHLFKHHVHQMRSGLQLASYSGGCCFLSRLYSPELDGIIIFHFIKTCEFSFRLVHL